MMPQPIAQTLLDQGIEEGDTINITYNTFRLASGIMRMMRSPPAYKVSVHHDWDGNMKVSNPGPESKAVMSPKLICQHKNISGRQLKKGECFFFSTRSTEAQDWWDSGG